MLSLNRILVSSIVLTCLFINPYGFDIYTNTRFASLLFFAALVLSIILFNFKMVINNKMYRNILYLVSFYLVCVISSLLFSGIDIFEGLTGIFGRNIGALTYISLLVLFFAAIISSKIENSYIFIKILLYLGIATCIYGVFQFFDLDPILTTKTYNPVKGFFGNPNFQSAFVGIAALAVSSIILSSSIRKNFRFFLLITLIFFIFVIYLTDSLQGFIVYAVGLYYLVYAKFRSLKKTKWLSFLMVLSSPVLLILLIGDILQKSPWTPILYQGSISFRGDFWRAGFNMFINNPFFGVGPDGYRDQYRLYRDSVAANRIETTPPINSAHNLFLEMAASGGLPLLISYVSIILLTLFFIFKLSKKSDVFNYGQSGLIACWIGYMSQAMVSVNTIPLSIIGWIFAGKIIGLGINSEGLNIKIKQKLPQILSVPLVALFAIAFPIVAGDISFKNALKVQDVNRIKSAAYKYPANVHTAGLVAEIFRLSNLSEIGTQVARDAVKMNPKNFEAWEELYQSKDISVSEKNYILSMMRKLDPLNTELR